MTTDVLPVVLIVEDDPDLLSLLRLKFAQEGFSVKAVATGSEALQALKTEKFSAVVLDILLPDIDGISILNEISTTPATKHLPVVVFSNLADAGSIEQVQALGKYDYLVKAKSDLGVVVKKIKERLGLVK